VKRLVQLILFVLIIAIAVFGTRTLIQTRSKSKRVRKKSSSTLVRIVKVQRSDEAIVLPLLGTVKPSKEVTITPEVTGRILEHNPRLMPGGSLKAGELIVRLDAREYELAEAQQLAAVERAEFDLKIEEGRQVIAQREWKLVGRSQRQPAANETLALRKPHLANSKAALAGARSGLERARLNVERSVIRCPFNAIVREEFVDVGQIVNPQTAIARLIGTDQFWIQVSIPVDKLARVRLPDQQGLGASTATIIQAPGNSHSVRRTGRVARLLGDIDPNGRMARLLITVDNPFDGDYPDTEKRLPLLVGSYVRVEIHAEPEQNIFVIPRCALRDGNRLWLMNAKDQLETRPVKIVWSRENTLLVRTGLSDGDRLIVSRIPTPLEGMVLRAEETTESSEEN